MLSNRDKAFRRQKRNRFKLSLRRNGLPRLSVFRSNAHIYAQIIDDEKRVTVVAASTIDKEMKKAKIKSTGSVEAATLVGKLIAEKAKSKGLTKVVFDRGAYLYHGRVKALADSARENGLEL